QIRQGCLASFVSKRSLATRSPADTADGPMAKDAAPSSPGVQFLVLALSEGESEHRWKGSCALAAPLSQLAKKWATFHQVPESSVGLELKGKELDLQKSPADYSLDTNAQVELLCFPKEEDFMEPQAEASRGERRRNREKARPEATSKPEKAKEEPEAKEKEAKGKKRRAEVKVENKAEPKKRERAGAKAETAKPSRAGGGLVENQDGMPGFEEPIEFLQTNPKKAGATSFDRYEKYKMAKTIKQALALGAAKGDIQYDWKKGYFKKP
ncbi:unnamed protein product, partial [Effrenium voratum]